MKHGILWVAEHVARMEKGKSPFKILTGKRPLGKSSRTWKVNIKMDLEEIGVNTRN